MFCIVAPRNNPSLRVFADEEITIQLLLFLLLEETGSLYADGETGKDGAVDELGSVITKPEAGDAGIEDYGAVDNTKVDS